MFGVGPHFVFGRVQLEPLGLLGRVPVISGPPDLSCVRWYGQSCIKMGAWWRCSQFFVHPCPWKLSINVSDVCVPDLMSATRAQVVWSIHFKGPAIKKFMQLVVIIGAHDVLRNFWIL